MMILFLIKYNSDYFVSYKNFCSCPKSHLQVRLTTVALRLTAVLLSVSRKMQQVWELGDEKFRGAVY